MPISFVGQASAAATSVTLPALQAGDLILAWVYQGTSNANTIALASGFTAIAAGTTGAGANAQSSRLSYKIATSAAETSGDWPNAEEIVAHVYRGVDPTTPIGGTSTMTGVADVTFPAITLAIADGSSWVSAFAGWRGANANLGTAEFPGLTRRSNVVNGAASRSSTFDTASGVTSYPGTSSSGATGFRYRTASVEMRAAAGGVSPTEASGSAVGSGSALAVGAASASATGSTSGIGTASASGRTIASAFGAASGTSVATAMSVGVSAALGVAAGVGAALALGRSLARVVGSASGLATVRGIYAPPVGPTDPADAAKLRIPLVPVDNASNDWPRKVANAVNALINLSIKLSTNPFMELDAEPFTPSDGQTYYDKTLKKVRTYAGGVWNNHW